MLVFIHAGILLHDLHIMAIKLEIGDLVLWIAPNGVTKELGIVLEISELYRKVTVHWNETNEDIHTWPIEVVLRWKKNLDDQ